MIELPEYIEELIEAGIHIEIYKHHKLGLILNLNLQSKSHLYLYKKDDKWLADMRYNNTHEIESFDDLLAAAKSGMHGRGYIHCAWADLLRERGYLKIVTETKTTYKWI